VVAIDAYNAVYQFLSIIRQPDGTPLLGPKGEVTSHLSGLFYRTLELLAKGVKPVYVFDGVPSKLKQRTISARIRRREEAHREWEEAVAARDVAQMRAKAMQSTRINEEIVESSRALLGLMGVANIKAPSEGEAQASWMASNGLSYAAVSQDYDTVLFGAPRVARNITFSGRRKLPGKNVYIKVEPEMINLEDTLSALQMSRKQLIWAGILIGTDFNEGIDGVGPKTACKIAKGARTVADIESYVNDKLGKSFDVDIREVEALFENPEVREISRDEMDKLLGGRCDADGTLKFMCDVHGFSKERIGKQLGALNINTSSAQKGIDKWLGSA